MHLKITPCTCSLITVASKPNKQFISACLYGDHFRSLTGGKVMKYVLPSLLFLTLFKMLELCEVPVGLSEDGTQNTEAFGTQRAAPMTHLYRGRGFILFLEEVRSEISASALQLGTVSAGGKAHHQRLIKDLYPFRHVFSHFWEKPYLLPLRAQRRSRCESGSCRNYFLLFAPQRSGHRGLWHFLMCVSLDYHATFSSFKLNIPPSRI